MPDAAITRFGTAPDGSPVERIILRADWGAACVMTWGASLQDLRLAGVAHSVILGSPEFDAYLDTMVYYGAVVGPVANRIAGGRFVLDGETFETDRNEGGITTLHGGAQGFGQRNWRIEETSETACTLALDHPDGLCGFPGNIAVRVTYAMEADGVLRIEIEGTADRRTVFNPAHHGYWNLDGTRDLSRHVMTLPADRYTPVDAAMIPTAEAPAPVTGTAFDYRVGERPGADLDHNFCYGDDRGPVRPLCILEAGGTRLDIASTEPGLQVYTGGGIDTRPRTGHAGVPYGPGAGVALEPQCWPDAPNRPDFPSVVLEPDAPHTQVSTFTFTRAGG